jgi:hypothetical protein
MFGSAAWNNKIEVNLAVMFNPEGRSLPYV